MGGFLESMRPGGSSRLDPAVVARLERLVRTREPVEILRRTPQGTEGRQFTMIQSVEPDSVIIGLPTGPGAERPLIQFGTYTLLMPGPEGTIEAESRVLERVRIKAGGDRMLRCYRISMPVLAQIAAAGPDAAMASGRPDAAAGAPAAAAVRTPLRCEGRIIPPGRGGPIPGVLEELSPDTARIRCSLRAALIRGAAVDFEADLPEPTGRLRAQGEILTVTAPANPHDGAAVVTLRFVTRQDVVGPELSRRIGGASAA